MTALVSDAGIGRHPTGPRRTHVGLRRLSTVAVTALVAALVAVAPAAASTGPRIIRDIQQGAGSSEPDSYSHITSGTVLFAASDSVHGRELWRSDGTKAGTRLVKDIASGVTSSNPDMAPAQLGRYHYFAASTPSKGTELWRTDGTAAGTTRVKDIRAGAGSSDPQNLVRVGARIYFYADDGTHGIEDWQTDGTASGTQLVEDINPSGDSMWCCLRALGDTLIFAADDGTAEIEPWRSRGTAQSTFRLADIATGPADSYGPSDAMVLDGQMLFSADDGLWRTDGTKAGTVKVKDLVDAYYFSRVGTKIVFMGSLASPRDRELWVTDGTPDGTRLLKDIDPEGSSQPRFWHDRAINGVALFQADDGERGMELWRTGRHAGGNATGQGHQRHGLRCRLVGRLRLPGPRRTLALLRGR